MTSLQKTIKYVAMAFAVFLTVNIFFGIFAALGALNLVENIVEKNDGVIIGESETYAVNDNVSEIKIDVGYAALTVTISDAFYVESNIDDITVKVNGDCLKIDDNSDIGNSVVNVDAGAINVYIPSDYSFETVDIDTGAGNVNIDSLTTSELELDIGAGDVDIKNVTTLNDTEISGGTGDLTVTDCKFASSELSMGVGKFSFSGELIGRSTVDMGVGEADITLLGSKDSYTLSVSKGIGAAIVDGQSINVSEVFGNGKNEIDISGGIGDVKVVFK